MSARKVGTRITRRGLSSTFATTGEVRSRALTTGADQAATIQAEANALATAGGGTLLLPAGTIRINSTVTIPGRVTLRGQGMKATTIEVGTTDPGLAAEYALNAASNPRYVRIADLAVARAAGATTGVGISLVGLAHANIERVHVAGFANGIVFQQITHGHIDDCKVENFGTTGVWLADGGDYKPGGTITPPFTNHISIKRNLILSNVAGSYGVVDDGGWNHEVSNNSFEGCAVQLRIAGVTAFRAANNEYEACLTGPFIQVAATSRAGTALPPSSLTLTDSVLDSPNAYDCISITAAITSLTVTHFVCASTGAAIKGMTNVQRYYGFGNRNDGGGAILDGVASTSHNELSAAAAAIGGTFTTALKYQPPGSAAGVALDLEGGYGIGRANPATTAGLDIKASASGRIRFLHNDVVTAQIGATTWFPPQATTGTRPSASAVTGAVYYDTGLARPVVSDGTDWYGMAKRVAANVEVDCPSISANSTTTVTVTVTGAAVGDPVILGAPATLEAGLMVSARVTATDTVGVRFANVTGSPIDPATATYKIALIK